LEVGKFRFAKPISPGVGRIPLLERQEQPRRVAIENTRGGTQAIRVSSPVVPGYVDRVLAFAAISGMPIHPNILERAYHDVFE
jgi:hypothetical protein